MHSLRCRDYTLELKLVNGYYMVTSKDFGIHFCVGHWDTFKTEDLGLAVMRCLFEIQVRLDQGLGPEKPERYLLTGEVAEILNTSKDTVRRMIEKGQLESVDSPGGHRRIKASSIEKLIQ